MGWELSEVRQMIPRVGGLEAYVFMLRTPSGDVIATFFYKTRDEAATARELMARVLSNAIDVMNK